MRVYGRYAPEFVIIIDLILSLNCPFPTSRNPHFGSEGKCKNFLVKMSFICLKIKKNHFPINGLALNLALKQRLWVSRNGLLEHQQISVFVKKPKNTINRKHSGLNKSQSQCFRSPKRGNRSLNKLPTEDVCFLPD